MNRASIKFNSRSGFVSTTTSLVMMALVAVAATELATAFSADVRRTRDQEVQAQLRQVLIAGIIQSREATAIQLPQELQKQDVTMAVGNKTITAEMGRNHLSIELP